ncbi:MAG TPA: glutamate-5-semialdehyde dehydrogenase [Polyangiaceae bacterium]|nr:glutamate-5-semialdehyde dehydrogenase [Polyangiaceae bacterium]
MSSVREQAEKARAAARVLRSQGRAAKDAALRAIANKLRAHAGPIRERNLVDIENARKNGMSSAMLDRLRMDEPVVEATARAVEYVASLRDPVGSRSSMQRLENGLLAGRERVPLGVIAMVYESRPNVTIDAGVLCLKSGNAVLLRGGKEAAATNQLLGELVRDAVRESGLPEAAIQVVPPTDRDGIRELLSLTGLVDLAIPRGGEGLIRFVTENARVPVIQHYKGVCHLFLDAGCDVEKAVRVAVNAKAQRPATCNALECLLVHAGDATRVLPPVARALLDKGVELRGCPRTLELVPEAKRAQDSDFGFEFSELILAVRVVDDLDGALDHIAQYGSNHSEAICTENLGHAERFLREVDASCVLVNASTRFNDGGQLGLGAEIGISTSKLHAYGPMGLESLTTEKWVVLGDGQVRS